MTSAAITFSLQAHPGSAASWTELARRAEDLGFDSLYVADHPGSGASPFVALAAAASVTTRLRLGSYVLNAGTWEPLLLANEVATLDLVSEGRAILGIGAGHTPAEWTMLGRVRPAPAVRVQRCIALASAVRRLLAGETVEVDEAGVVAHAAQLTWHESGRGIPLLVGGGNRALLDFAAVEADLVGLSGLGRTLPDGHAHEVRWTSREVAAQTDRIRAQASAAGRSVPLEALVQRFAITDDAEASVTAFADEGGVGDPADLLDVPYVQYGSAAQIAERMRAHAERFGITRYAVRGPMIDDVVRVMAELG